MCNYLYVHIEHTTHLYNIFQDARNWLAKVGVLCVFIGKVLFNHRFT